jgi:sterol desaturase/sphingolipid hydroxylase (fatty acid hydroxylase superfamily)
MPEIRALEQDFGIRDTRGEWRPAGVLKPAPIFVWPPQPLAFLKWLFVSGGYLLPWNVFYVALAIVTWSFLTPALPRMATFRFDWIATIYLRNLGILIVFAGILHLRLYIQRAQDRAYKYNSHWPSTSNPTFLFHNQVFDNVFWSIVSGCTFWSAYEVVLMWAYANNLIPYVSWATSPVYCVLLLFAIPVWRLFHFYWIHRLIHWKPLYDKVHYLHHKNVNIGPWSGLAMHPVEHLIYFSVVLIHWIVPSHPVHVIFNLQHTGLTPAQGHSGFDEILLAGGAKIPNHNYMHYLHHRYQTVNYGDGLVPLDKWFGSFHDGSDKSHAEMRKKQT